MENDILNYIHQLSCFVGLPVQSNDLFHRKLRSGGWIYNFLIGCKVKRQGTIDLRKKLLILNSLNEKPCTINLNFLEEKKTFNKSVLV